ncbi:MAG: hypothetical protein AAF899_05770 [Pseudomonadota bacterium]
MSGEAAQGALPTTSAADRLEGMIAEVEAGIGLLDRERRLCRAGRLDALAAIAAEKQALSTRLATGMTGLVAAEDPAGAARLRRAIDQLARRARRNERLLAEVGEAVRRVRRARRLSESLRAGRVGYGPDGRTVVSRADAARRSRKA